MQNNFEYCLNKLLAPSREGGFVNDPQDPGGITNHGVTMKVWEEWVGRTSNEEEMRNLTIDDVAPLYKARYWDVVGGDELPGGVDHVVFDCAVNGGVKRAGRLLQACMGMEQDGVIGQETIIGTEQVEPQDLINEFSQRRLQYLQALPTFGHFGKGWTRRVNEVEEEAKQIA